MTTTISYRKTKTGEWVAYAPAAAVAGTVEQITVTKRDGSTKTETIERLGRPFVVDGREMVYCYLAKAAWPTTTTTRKPSSSPCDECGERRGYIECRDSSGLMGLCCSRCAAGSDYARSFA